MDGMFLTIRRIYSRPKYIAVNIAALILYYLLMTTMVSYQNHGILLLPNLDVTYFIYALAVTSSIAITIGVYSVRNTMRNQARVTADVIGTATSVFGGIAAGCGCSNPVLFSVAALFAVGSSQATYLDVFLADNQIAIFIAMILINVVVIAYYLNKLSKPSCTLSRNKG